MEQELEVLSGTVAVSELREQISIARDYPRNWDTIVEEVESRATKRQSIAEECFYSLTKGNKKIEGPGVRFAELILASLNNVRIGTRIVSIDEKEITAECIIYDLQMNRQFNVRESRSIVDKYGKRYSQDLIMTTGKAAIALARRNCIFQAVPMVEFEETLRKAKMVGSGQVKGTQDKGPKLSLEERRTNALAYFNDLGVDEDRVLFALKLTHIDEIDENQLATLVGIRTALKDNDTTIDEAFPNPRAKERAQNVKSELFDTPKKK